MKKSVVLLVVLGFIIILMTLATYLLKIYDKYISYNQTYIAQDKIVIKDTKDILDSMFKDINGSDISKIFNSYPPIISKDNSFILNVTINPIFNKININNYLNKKLNPYIDDTLTNILTYYSVEDIVLFKDILLDSIDSDKNERENGTEIVLTNSNFQDGKIYNKKDFKEILDYYYKITNDKLIYKIPWDKFLFFGNLNQINLIDCAELDKNLAKFMGLKFDYDIMSCENLKNDENKKILENFNIKKFNKKESYWIEVILDYKLNGVKNNLKMIYDITKKEVINIEKHPVY